MNGKEFKNMFEMYSMLAKEGCEMENEDTWQEDIRWMTDEIRAIIDGKYRKMRILHGVKD